MFIYLYIFEPRNLGRVCRKKTKEYSKMKTK